MKDHRLPVDRNLESLKFSLRQISRIGRDKAIHERIWILGESEESATHVFDKPDIAEFIGVDALIAPLANAAVECAQARAPTGIRVEVSAHLDYATSIPVLLGKEQGV